jgi:AcrR family transcriptional regulator
MSDQDTKQKIVEASTYLFGVKGYDGTSTREIAQRAGVNIASLNYHFKSKQGLLKEVTAAIIEEFKQKIIAISANTEQSTVDFCLNFYQAITEDKIKLLNHFKLFLDSGNCAAELDTTPPGYEALSKFLRKELNASVPADEIIWASSVIFTYIMHSAVMSGSDVGKQHIERYLPKKEASIPVHIKRLVETCIRDLNHRYS